MSAPVGKLSRWSLQAGQNHETTRQPGNCFPR